MAILHLDPRNQGILKDPLVDNPLNVGQLHGCERAAGKIERQFVRADIGPLLRSVLIHDFVQSPVQQVGHRMMPLHRIPAGAVHGKGHFGSDWRCFRILQKMKPGVPRLLRVHHPPQMSTATDLPHIPNLPTHLRIERRGIQQHGRLVLDPENLKNPRGCVQLLVTHELRRGRNIKTGNLDDLLLLSGPGTGFLLLHQAVEALHLHSQPALAGHQFGEVQRKPVGIVKLEGKFPAQHAPLQGANLLQEQVDSTIQGLVEGHFLPLNHIFNMILPGAQFRKNIPHGVCKDVHQLVEKRFPKAQGAPIPHGPTQNAAEDVVPVGIPRLDPIRNGKTQGADMVPDHAESDINPLLFRCTISLLGEGGGIPRSTQCFQPVEDRPENVGLIVRNHPGEIGKIPGVLNDARNPLKTHPGIHMPGRERGECPIGICIELDEHQVPDLDALCRTLVHQTATGIPGGGQVHMNLAAGTARAGVPHHPEIVLLAPVHDLHGGIQTCRTKLFRPVIPGFLVKLTWIPLRLVGAINRGIKAVLGELPDFGDQLPRPIDRLPLEVIPKRPVPEHLEKGVVIGVQPDVLEVVVLATRPDALLGVGRAGILRRNRLSPLRDVSRTLPKKNGHKLVHPGVREQKVRRIGHQTRGAHDRVLLRSEKVEV